MENVACKATQPTRGQPVVDVTELMEITNLKISKIKPYKNNPRINDDAAERVANSIRDFGFRVPIILDKDNVIICGHTRLKAAKMLGLKDVPCIYADDLTDEQVKAYRLADNKVSESAEWDYELLDEEIQNILDFDMTDYGFEFTVEEDDADDWHQLRTDKHYNLDGFDINRTEGKFEMPILKPVDYIPKRLIGFNYAQSSKDYDAGLHFYLDDYQFERVWTEPERYIDIISRFDCSLAPTFSLYMDMPRAEKIYNVFRSRLLGQMMQDAGIVTIPIVYWAGEESYEYCFDGLPEGGTFSTYTMGIHDNDVWKVWEAGAKEFINRKRPDRILLYGNGLIPDFDFGDIEIVTYNNNVTERMKGEA